MKLSQLHIALLGPLTTHAHGERKHAPAAQAVAEQTAWGIAGKPRTGQPCRQPRIRRLIAGHCEAGMRGTINLTSEQGAAT